MSDHLFSYVKPETIQAVYAQMIEVVRLLQGIQMQKTELAVKLNATKATMAAQPDFKWGANDTVRDAQVAQFAPELIAEIAQVKLEEQKVLDQKEIILLNIQMYHDIVSLFEAIRPLEVVNVS